MASLLSQGMFDCATGSPISWEVGPGHLVSMISFRIKLITSAANSETSTIAAARAMGGTFLLRIEDTDRSRHVEDSVGKILDDLDRYEKVLLQRDRR